MWQEHISSKKLKKKYCLSVQWNQREAPFIKFINPLTPNDLLRRRAVSPLKIEIPSKNMDKKPTNETIIHSVD
jgi:hypothetical protein